MREIIIIIISYSKLTLTDLMKAPTLDTHQQLAGTPISWHTSKRAVQPQLCRSLGEQIKKWVRTVSLSSTGVDKSGFTRELAPEANSEFVIRPTKCTHATSCSHNPGVLCWNKISWSTSFAASDEIWSKNRLLKETIEVCHHFYQLRE